VLKRQPGPVDSLLGCCSVGLGRREERHFSALSSLNSIEAAESS
jgi:hypothetical protein